MGQNKKFDCTDCGTRNCYRQKSNFPQQCPTMSLKEEELNQALDIYRSDEQLNKLMHTAAQIEGKYYGQQTRVEEIMSFASTLGVEKIGVAACVGLHHEASIFTRIVREKGFNIVCIICKIGSVDKCELGIGEEYKIQQGQFEASCNPVLQAQMLNREQTSLNVVIGLCVGHDSIFYKHSEAPATTLLTKDRVLGHNPAAALYTYHSYYNKITGG